MMASGGILVESLTEIEERIHLLESQVAGVRLHRDVTSSLPLPRPDATVLSLGARITALSSALQPKLSELMKEYLGKYDSLKSLMEEELSSEDTLSLEAKLGILDASQSHISEVSKQLELVNSLRSIIDNTEKDFKELPQQLQRIRPLELMHLQQRADGSEVVRNGEDLLLQYNGIIQAMSQQFLYLDETLAVLEAQKAKK